MESPQDAAIYSGVMVVAVVMEGLIGDAICGDGGGEAWRKAKVEAKGTRGKRRRY